MLQHVVALTWNESVPENYAEVVNKALLDMAEFDDVAGWQEYDQNALHNEVRVKYFAPYVASRAAAQITF
jgi:hypothetical protein